MNRSVGMQVWYGKKMPRVAVFMFNHLKGRECVRVYHKVTHASVQRLTSHFGDTPADITNAHRDWNRLIRIGWEAPDYGN